MRYPISVLVLSLLCVHGLAAETPSPASETAAKDNDEIARLFAEDQHDRAPNDGKPIDWMVVGPRDAARRKRAMELYSAGELKTGRDYLHAGMILQHGDRPEDFLLCHELCVAAVFKSEGEQANWRSLAKWLAAASEDRFLTSIGRSQRFGTQFSQERGSPWRLNKMEAGVTDDLRKAWNVPPLANATEREAEMNTKKTP